MAERWTDEQLRQVVMLVARLYLEVERGLRPRSVLRRFLTGDADAAQHAVGLSRFPRGGPVSPDDLSRLAFCRATERRVFAALAERQQEGRWGALLLELRADARGVWRVTELTRAQDRNLVHDYPVRQLQER
jgi:hypothetical protein